MINLLNSFCFMLAQNEAEKQMTIAGLIFFVVMILMLIVDSITKNQLVPKDRGIKVFLFIVFALAFAAVILLVIYYK